MTARVCFTVNGDVTFADPGNAFVLTDSDMIFAAVTFDDTNTITDGCGAGCDLVSLYSLCLAVGNFSFNETYDLATVSLKR